jgi:hypothetical protein
MQSRNRKIIVLLFGVATAAAIGYAVHLSLNPNYYFFYNSQDRASWVYDAESVAFICGFMLLESAVACLAIVATRPRQLWARCVLALLALGPWAFVSTMYVVHMPGYTLFHHLWVWLLVLLLAACLVSSVIRQLVLRSRGGPPNSSSKPTPLRGAA